MPRFETFIYENTLTFKQGYVTLKIIGNDSLTWPQRRLRLHACVRVAGGHFEHYLHSSCNKY